MPRSNTEWLEGIAAKAKVSVHRVESLLVAHHIEPAPILGLPRHLMLNEIVFSGVKDGVSDAGQFEFRWDSLGAGLWAMVTDQNLRGKSSIMEVVRWLLRGRASSNLQLDVQRWIHNAHIRFALDDVAHEVAVETQGGTRGSLRKLGLDGNQDLTLATFESAGDFEAVMADFFMHALAVDAITNWRKSGDDDQPGQPVAHGWVAFSGAMFIGTNYEVLLGDMPVDTGLNPRLMQMYLGLPWVSTLASAKSAQKALQNQVDIRSRRRTKVDALKRVRVDTIAETLAVKRSELSKLPSDQAIRDKLAVLSLDFADLKRSELETSQRLEREKLARRQAEDAHKEDRRELQSHLDSMAAGAVFRSLDPTCCPRCDHSIGEARKKQEETTHACSVCGESISSSEDATVMRNELDARAKASKAAYDKAAANEKQARAYLSDLQENLSKVQASIDENSALLGSFAKRQELLTAISVLEGRLQEASYDPEPVEEEVGDDLVILDAVVSRTEQLVTAIREDLLNDVSIRLAEYARRFGMHNLSEATLKGNANLSLVKGGADTSYSKVTEGEKLRLKVATTLAMIEVAEKRGVGRHPGLLMIDSPAAQEVSPKDVDELVAGLQSVSKEISHLQVFVAGLTSTAITEHISPDNRREALDGGFLW